MNQIEDRNHFNQQDRTINAGRNAIYALSNKALIFILNFILRRVFIVHIGVAYLGINGLFANVLTLLSMADLGLETALNVSLYKPIAENNDEEICGIINLFSKIYLVIAFVIFVLGVSLIPFLKYIINLDSTVPHIYLYYMMFLLKNVASYLLIYKSSIIYADQKSYIINKIDAFVGIFRVSLQLAVVFIFENYLAYLIIEIIMVILRNGIISYRADRIYPFIKRKSALSTEKIKSIKKNIYSVFFYKVSFALINGTDNVLISTLIGTIYVGLYSNYLLITDTISNVISLVFNSMTASVGNLVAIKKPNERLEVFNIMQLISYWISALVVCELLVLLQRFVVIWIGEDYTLDSLTVIAIVINLYFSICMRPVWTFREGTGMYHYIKYIMLWTAVLNIILSIILGKLIGLPGILFATSISKFVTYFWYEPYILFKTTFSESVKKYYISYFFNGCITGICIFICMITPFGRYMPNFMGLIIDAVLIFILVTFVFVIAYRNNMYYKNIKHRIITLLYKLRRKHGD